MRLRTLHPASLGLLAAVAAGGATAAPSAGEPAPAPTFAQARATLEAVLARELPGAALAWVKPTASPHLIAFKLAGQPSASFATSDGKMLLPRADSAVDLDRNLDLMTMFSASDAKDALKGVPAADRIIFKAENEAHRLIVFTDVDCGYCQKLHQQVAAFNEKGITLEYLLVARAGEASATDAKHRQVWCAADRNAALTQAKAQQPLADATCDTPLARIREAAASVGMSGTPMVLSPDGFHIGGYLEPDQALAHLRQLQLAAASKR